MNPDKIKTAVVTGASSGIGRATALQLAEQGMNVFAVARRTDRLDELHKQNSRIIPVVQDVTLPLTTLETAIAGRKIDILVNNAGLAWGKDPIHEMPRHKWETMLDVNVKALIAVTQLVLPRMLEAGVGDIVNIGSVAGYESYAGGAGYCASKFAVRAITESMRHDLLGKNIRVIGIHPGMVETEFSIVRFDGDTERAKKHYEGMRPLTANDIAETIAWTLARPRHVNIDSLVILSTDQVGATHVWRG